MPETYWKNGKDWCRCHGTRPKYCPGEDVTTYSSGGKDWCTCCGERPYRCKNSKSYGVTNSTSGGGFTIPTMGYTWKF